MIKVGVFGATGKMGRLIIELLKNDQDLMLFSAFVYEKVELKLPDGCIATDDYEIFLKNCDAIIDFSAPVATERLIKELFKSPKIYLCGTTGLSSEQKALLNEASLKMPILYATNMSLGVALLNRLVEMASRVLIDFDIEIVEMHHRYKKDAPSGTALTLAESAAKARELELSKVRVSSRDGEVGVRKKDEIAVMALRGGDIFGRHTVGFYGDGEFIELNHTATSRETFAKGAIKALKWLANKQNGLYKISDALGI